MQEFIEELGETESEFLVITNNELIALSCDIPFSGERFERT